MESGLLNRRILFQRKSATRDEFGGLSDVWEDVTTAWAFVKPLKGTEIFKAQQVHPENTHNFHIRYREDLNEAMRIVYKGINFDILSFTEQDDNRRELVILTKQGMSSG